MSGDHWRAVYEALDPHAVLSPDAGWYCPRPDPPLRRLVTQLRLARRPGLYLVAGHIGSGKSTELQWLAHQLSDRYAVQVELVDAELGSEPADEMALLAATTLTLAALERGKSLADLRHSNRVVAKGSKLAAVAASALFGISSKASDPEPLGASELTEQMKSLGTKIRAHTNMEPLVVLDGFDKVALEQVERILAAPSSWELPVSIVMTVPLSLLFTPRYAKYEASLSAVAVVPAIRVQDIGGRPNEEGIGWLESVLYRRQPTGSLHPAALRHLALSTGGILRDFIRVTREAVLSAILDGAPWVSESHVEAAVSEFAVRLARPISAEDTRLLAAVSQYGRVIGHSSFLRMIGSGQIIEYRNGSTWYAVHPLLRATVERFARELRDIS